MRIEELDVSEACREKLKSAGFRDVDEIAKLLQQVVGNATLNISWGECFDEVVNKLIIMGLLSEDLFD